MQTPKHLSVKVIFLAMITLSCARSEKYSRSGITLLEQGKSVSALAQFEKALMIDESDELALYGKGLILAKSPYTYDLAEKMIKSSLAHLPEKKYKVNAYNALIEIYYAQENIKKIKQTLINAQKNSIVSPQLLLTKANINKNNVEKEKIFAKAISLYPNDQETKTAYIKFNAQTLKNHRLVSDYLEKEIQTSPKPNWNYATALWNSNQKEKARKYIAVQATSTDEHEDKTIWKNALKRIKKGKFKPDYRF